MSIDLQRFCASELDLRTYLRTPWLFGEWVYATNGHMAVRVPAADRPDITVTPEKAPNAAVLFERAFECDGGFLPMPVVPAAPKCMECDGTGKVRAIKCPDCEDGDFRRGSYTYECQNCLGSPAGAGWQHLPDEDFGPQPHEVQRMCHECDGHGVLMHMGKPVRIGDVWYAGGYLAVLSTLPNVRIKPDSNSRLLSVRAR